MIPEDWSVDSFGGENGERASAQAPLLQMQTNKMPKKQTSQKRTKTVGTRIIEGLEQALIWPKRKPSTVPLNLVRIPDFATHERRQNRLQGKALAEPENRI